MKTMKTFTALLLSLMLLIPLAACGGTDTASDSTAENASLSESESSGDAAEADADADADADTDNDANADEETSNSQAPLQGDIPAEYDGEQVDDACAKVMCDYFKAIANQDYDAYKATLNKEYFRIYNSWLVAAYSYGMESSFELQHEALMDQAGAKDNVVITGLSLSSVKDEETEALITEYLADYDKIIGEGFSDTIRESCDEIIDVVFTMKGICDGGEETDILKDMEMLITIKDGEYTILG